MPHRSAKWLVEVPPAPPVDEPADETADSTHALWHDPTVYDHMQHGPPYLPEQVKMVTTMHKTAADEMTEITAVLDQVKADFGKTPMSELTALLAFIRAEATVHQAHHWQTRGDYGDHLMFGRLYSDVTGHADTLAERMVGSGHYILAHPMLLAKHCSMVVQTLYRDAGANPVSDSYPALSLRAVLRTLSALKLVYSALEEKQQLSHGIDNLLQGIADQHEQHVYLLKQRLQSKTASYDRRQ